MNQYAFMNIKFVVCTFEVLTIKQNFGIVKLKAVAHNKGMMVYNINALLF